MTSIAAWCDVFGWLTLGLAVAFLGGALVAAWVETRATMNAKAKAAAEADKVDATKVNGLADPVELLEALKGLLEALKGLPAWIAVFLAGLALLWLASDLPEACACGQGNEACSVDSDESDESDDGESNNKSEAQNAS